VGASKSQKHAPRPVTRIALLSSFLKQKQCFCKTSFRNLYEVQICFYYSQLCTFICRLQSPNTISACLIQLFPAVFLARRYSYFVASTSGSTHAQVSLSDNRTQHLVMKYISPEVQINQHSFKSYLWTRQKLLLKRFITETLSFWNIIIVI
jgi:hypothetical protein